MAAQSGEARVAGEGVRGAPPVLGENFALSLLRPGKSSGTRDDSQDAGAD